ncbi:DNA-directed RNA polymerases I, II, and III subunit RPABC3 [Agyrium rufum]|nr:DNA-directed RNA polymerases I, II, and III subunit RPABC3 [Agyrium rufum]
MADSQLFEDTFTISAINHEKYDRVGRLTAESESHDTKIHLDVNTELYPITEGDRLHITLASTLSLDGSNDHGKEWREVGRGGQTLADFYDYVCHGKIYRFDEAEGNNIKVFVSFGGLLLYMDGPYKKLTPLKIEYIYLLMKKT